MDTFWTKFFGFLSFMNVLEPGTRVLSVSKIMMWMTTVAVAGAVWTGQDIATVLSAAGAQLVAVGNYVHRRQRSGSGTEYNGISDEPDRR